MSKKNIRLLALGFLLSSLLIVTLNGLFQTESEASDRDQVDELQNEIHFLEEKVVSLELDNERLLGQVDSTSTALNSPEEEAESQEEDSQEMEEETEAEDEEETPSATTYTVVIEENEPSSVIADQLLTFGLIEDRHAFNEYLEESGAYLRVRAGSYTITSEMNRDEIVQAIIN
ncbi:hypothetical protein GCM10008932_21580 [Alkalibacterium iburiense]|uniref:Endolytic transglycosylase MltG n=1 Tax=Alkalibacterium iburiense TaxID=290589 RepID=A0ABN0XPK8_9LACT